MQVKSLTLISSQLPEIIWPRKAFQHTIKFIEKTYHRIFGCWHTDMSRPFTIDQQTYRMCLNCGAHRTFDTQQWKMVGPYYVQPPSIKTIYRPVLKAVKSSALASADLKLTSRHNLRRVAA